VHRLFARQLAKAKKADGEVDLEALGELVDSAYAQSDRDRRRTDRSISLMIEELDQLNRSLERLVEERTSALRERETELEAQNFRFDTALNNMSQALLMFDSEARLVISNQRYREMYGLTAEVVEPGRSLQELLLARKAAGSFTGDPEEYTANIRARIAEGKPDSQIVELPDGRTIAILNHPMRGGGWVATHEDITERRRAETQIAHMARHDSLTDLPNRLSFRERLAQAFAGLHKDERLAVLYLDLDRFKNVNDTLGHHIGDELLKVVAGRLRGSIEEFDMVARVGGDEFAIIQSSMDMPIDTENLARKVCEAIKAPYEIEGHEVVVDTCIGIAIAPDDGKEPNEILRNADMALYGAKADGPGTYRFFEPHMDARMRIRRELEIALRKAFAHGEFELHYQPLLDLNNNRITCCEALIRWNHPEHGMIPPSEFIPIAEEIGLISPLGEWVLRQACADAVSWPEEIKVAVNLSPIQVMNKNLIPVVVNALAAAGLPPHRLEIEITESVLMQNTESTLTTLHRLQELGVRISMDDFGTGYSSLSYLRSFPFDKIKIDRCFISGLPNDDSVAIVRAIAGLAKSLSMITTAEGVETQEQFNEVQSLGCTEMQGFFFSRPRPAREISRILPARDEKRALRALAS
jgi:diguanylate cyclase (GGDEF)-like protein/PAS domain S-box-containing protein